MREPLVFTDVPCASSKLRPIVNERRNASARHLGDGHRWSRMWTC